MRFQFRFTEPDREHYGDGTYELDVSPDGLSRLEIGTLERFEEQTGMRVLGDWLTLLGQNQLKAVRACLWLARYVADSSWDVSFADFQPDVLGIISGADFRYLPGAEGNAPSPATNRATRRQSPRTSKNSSAAGRRRASAS